MQEDLLYKVHMPLLYKADGRILAMFVVAPTLMAQVIQRMQVTLNQSSHSVPIQILGKTYQTQRKQHQGKLMQNYLRSRLSLDYDL